MPRSIAEFMREVAMIRAAHDSGTRARRLVLASLRRRAEPITAAQLGEHLRQVLSTSERDEALQALIANGEAVKREISRGGRTLDGYQAVPQPEPQPEPAPE